MQIERERERERKKKEVRILLHLEPSHYTCIENITSFFNWNIYKLKNITFISQKVWSNQNMSIQNNGLKRYTPIISQKTISTSILVQTCFTSKRYHLNGFALSIIPLIAWPTQIGFFFPPNLVTIVYQKIDNLHK